jgi:hypothetical protein
MFQEPELRSVLSFEALRLAELSLSLAIVQSESAFLFVRVRRAVHSYKVGDMLPVQPVPGGYPLPQGLPDGAVVRVVAFIHAYRVVEWQGRQLKVYMANIDSGLKECPRLTRRRPGAG